MSPALGDATTFSLMVALAERAREEQRRFAAVVELDDALGDATRVLLPEAVLVPAADHRRERSAAELPAGHNGAMGVEYDHTAEFRGASFTDSDLNGVTIRACDLRRLKITDSWFGGASVSGEIGPFVVNDVDVTEFVTAELDRRHPERVHVRKMRTAQDFRATWALLERAWSDTVARAGRLPEPARQERVDDEWSFAETLRHLMFATDAWAARTILGPQRPFHRLGVTHTSYPPADAAAIGIDLGAQPSFAEVLEARADRMALVRGIVDNLTDAELERPCSNPPAPGYPEEERSVGSCLRVVMEEECEHHRYATRDLATLEARQP